MCRSGALRATILRMHQQRGNREEKGGIYVMTVLLWPGKAKSVRWLGKNMKSRTVAKPFIASPNKSPKMPVI